MEKSNKLAIPQNFQELSKDLNFAVLSVINANTISGFEKAYTIASAIDKLQRSLTPEYMKPIMALQGNRLGFKADKTYDEATVKNCLIEAVLMGLQPFGNEFNIIAGNAYATKEGLGSVLKKINGLVYEITPALPRIDTSKNSAAVVMKIRWTLNGGDLHEREIDFAIKLNQYMGADAVIGKATRKARKWLHDTLNGFEIPEGDVSDLGINSQPNTPKISLEDLTLLFEMKKENLPENLKKDGQRIIDNKEEKSYQKLFNELQKL